MMAMNVLDRKLAQILGLLGWLAMGWLSPVWADQLTKPLYQFPQTATSLEFSPDGNYLLAAGRNGIKLYLIPLGSVVREYNRNDVFSASFAPHGRHIVVNDDDEVRVFDAATSEILFTSSIRYPNARYSRDGQYLIVASRETGYVKVIDTKNWRVSKPFLANPYVPASICLSPKQNWFLFSPNPAAPDNTLYERSFLDGSLHHQWEGHTDATTAYAYSPDGNFILSGGNDHTIKVWDYSHESPLRSFPTANTVIDLTMTADGKYMLYGDATGAAFMVDFFTGETKRSFASTQRPDKMSVAVSPRGDYVATTEKTRNYIQVWDNRDFYAMTGETPVETPTAAPTPTATRTPTPTFTLTPTSTPRHYPVSTLKQPNIRADFVTFYDEYNPKIAVDPRNGDLYLGRQIANNRQLILGPIHPNDPIYNSNNSPIYAELPRFNSYSNNIYGMIVTTEGTLYSNCLGALYKIPEKGVVQEFYPTADIAYENRLYFYDLYEAKEGDQIPGAHPGNLVSYCYHDFSDYGNPKRGLYDIQVVEINIHKAADNIRVIARAELPGIPICLTKGFDRHVYILACGYMGDIWKESNLQILRVEMNGDIQRIFTQAAKSDSPATFAFWPKDNSFFIGTNNGLSRLNPLEGILYPIITYNKVNNIVVSSHDGENLYTTDNAMDRWNEDKYIEKLSLTAPFPTASAEDKTSPFPTALPEGYPTPTPTPTFTPTSTPTPIAPAMYQSNYELKTIAPIDTGIFAVHPKTGDILYASCLFGGKYSSVNTVSFSYLPPSQMQIDMDVYPAADFQISSNYYFNDLAISESGLAYFLADTIREIDFSNREKPVRFISLPEAGRNRALCIVKEGDRIPGAKPGNILILQNSNAYSTNRILCIDPREETPTTQVLVSEKQFKMNLAVTDLTTGPGGLLYLMTENVCKIFVLKSDGNVEEWFHGLAGYSGQKLEYLPSNNSFYIFSKDSWKINRVSCDKKLVETVTGGYAWFPCLGVSPDGTLLYFPYESPYPRHLWSIRDTSEYPTPTPTPVSPEPTPTPTPIRGWFVLDGCGGIHSTNPDVKRPVLPYFFPNNIIRDLEPDPQGRGWYMLDGLGGIHRSSEELPLPKDFPYFGFDIARNLEIRNTPEGYSFYLLDGYGVVHSNDPSFQYGSFPWFGEDQARDIEPDPNGEGWLMMDSSGFIYSNSRPVVDTIRFAHPMALNPIMRGFIRFPDERTVMLDFYGGRHTNPMYPARNLVDGLPADFYFPGWDIIWDLELIPSNYDIHSQ